MIVALLASAYLVFAERRPIATGTKKEPVETSRLPRESPAKVAALARRVQELEGRVLLQEAARPSNGPTQEAAANTAVQPRDSVPSNTETLRYRSASYTTMLEGEARDASAARAHEAAVTEYINNAAPGALESVECRRSICRLTLVHSAGKTRDELGALWGDGPLTNGAYDHVSEDGKKTFAYFGMPGHALPLLDLYGAPVVP